MPVKNNGPGMTGRSSMMKISKIEPEYPQWAESKMRAIENRRLKALQKIVPESKPEILAIVAEDQKTGSDSNRPAQSAAENRAVGTGCSPVR